LSASAPGITPGTQSAAGHGQSIRRGGSYNRLAEPSWADPLDSSHSQRTGGRWNAPGAFAGLYLNDGVPTARLQVLHKLKGQPYGPEDLSPDEQHDLVLLDVPEDEHYLDCVTDEGLRVVGLPSTYPRHPGGSEVSHAECRPIGQRAWDDVRSGVACRSAATSAAPTNEELVFFDHPGRHRPTVTDRVAFANWWWGEPAA